MAIPAAAASRPTSPRMADSSALASSMCAVRSRRPAATVRAACARRLGGSPPGWWPASEGAGSDALPESAGASGWESGAAAGAASGGSSAEGWSGDRDASEDFCSLRVGSFARRLVRR
jgi:hypothetical protein